MADRSSTVAVLGSPPFVAALGVLTLLGVVWAAAVPRPEPVIPGLRRGEAVEQLGALDESTDVQIGEFQGAYSGPGGQGGDTLALILGWGAIGLLALVAGFCLALLLRWLVTGRERRTPAVDDAPDLDLQALAVAVTTDTSQRLDVLSAGTPAQGIIAAWAHLEATLHEAGVPLAVSRTSTEVSLVVLRRFSVDPHTLEVLAGLYREARWSQHPLTEHDRSRAATAYRALDADVRAAMTSGSSGAVGAGRPRASRGRRA